MAAYSFVVLYNPQMRQWIATLWTRVTPYILPCLRRLRAAIAPLRHVMLEAGSDQAGRTRHATW